MDLRLTASKILKLRLICIFELGNRKLHACLGTTSHIYLKEKQASMLTLENIYRNFKSATCTYVQYLFYDELTSFSSDALDLSKAFRGFWCCSSKRKHNFHKQQKKYIHKG